MTLRKVRFGDAIAGLAGLALIGLLFAPWFRPGAAGAGDETAWGSLTVVLAFMLLTALFGIAILALTAFERTPALPVVTGVLAVPPAIVTLILVIIRVIVPPDDGSVRWGAWAGLACTALVLAGVLRSMRVDVRP